MKANFEACMAEVFKHEGGYVNDPHDPGGETNMGISKRSYPKENIRGMTRARAAQIYRRDFWDKLRCDELPDGLDLVAFDAAVNSGPSRGAKWLQQALGVAVDGKVGLATIGAAKNTYAPAAVMRAIGFRRAFLKTLPTWERYKNGWNKRLDSVEAVASAMAGHDVPVRPDVEPVAPQPAAVWWWAALWKIFEQFARKWRV
mgnify:FL=1